ncbi:Rieske 2Fe-2S domain-containing protein, partial [Candidatus Frankia alpina]|uniref:Rieske 2Fe-2S domain-containing protein n=1 Tax=Candidatus Frankia alpina TaxID=2699483 RepID=UPI002E265A66
QRGPAGWTDVLAADEVTTALRQVEVDGVPVLLTRVDGRIVAINDRCMHRGVPWPTANATATAWCVPGAAAGSIG